MVPENISGRGVPFTWMAVPRTKLMLASWVHRELLDLEADSPGAAVVDHFDGALDVVDRGSNQPVAPAASEKPPAIRPHRRDVLEVCLVGVRVLVGIDPLGRAGVRVVTSDARYRE